MKVVERVLERRLCRIVSVDEIEFGFMPERGTIDDVFILRRMQEEYHAKGRKLYMCFVDLVKTFDSLPRKVLEWAIRKKGIPDILIRSVMSLYEGTKTRGRVDSELLEEFEVKVGMHQGSVLLPFLFAVVVDVVTKFSSELLYTDDFILISETIVGLRNKSIKFKEDFMSEGLKVNLGKTKVSGDITKDGMSKSKVDPCEVCSLKIKVNSVLCVQSCK